jgi:gluconolactonase
MRTLDTLRLLARAALVSFPLLAPAIAMAQAPAAPAAPPAPRPLSAPVLPPSHVVNVMTPEGSAVFGAKWKTMEAKLVEGPPIQGSMPEYKNSYDWNPRAGVADFDDSAWSDAGNLGTRRGGGKVSFIWYRALITIPAKIGDFDTAGSIVVLSVNVDDYAEVWVDGQLNRRSGMPSPAIIQGMSTPNRVVLTDAAKPGDKFQIAVFGINGPISMAPANTVWFREAKMEFFK